MGYKLAGFDVIGNVEIDPKMNKIYKTNHSPKFNFEMDIRDFNKIPNEQLPKELFNLDILDGSPPCTTFSISGKREEFWGIEKKFKEGQKKQTLDDLSFVFIETVKKLQPKVVVMENVEGLTQGSAWAYVQNIYRYLNEIGYNAKHWVLEGEKMGVPQTRHRFVLVAHKKTLDYPELHLHFNYKPILFKDIKSQHGVPGKPGKLITLINGAIEGDLDLSFACRRMFGKNSFFNNKIVYDDRVCPTVTAKKTNFRFSDKKYMSNEDIINASTFPQDYNFLSNTQNNVSYTCGMSVPPVMIKRVANEIYQQWFKLEDNL